MQNEQGDGREVERLWRSVKRDLLAIVELRDVDEPGGDLEHHNRRLGRMLRNWRSLCDLDIGVASFLQHELQEAARMLGNEDVTRYQHGKLDELIGVAEMGRRANPGAEVGTVGDLLDLGQEEIERQTDDAVRRFGDEG